MLGIRLAGTVCILVFTLIWWFPTYVVWSDYQDLQQQALTVRISLLTLWVPVGFFGVFASTLVMAPKCIYKNQKMYECFSPESYSLSAKVSKYFAILGIFTAIAFAWHSFNLLDEYGYKYNSKLTKFTPTGIHLVYTKP